MLTLKFGGTSMGSARRILDSVEIMTGRAKTDRISVVVSAVAGVSNKLQAAIDGCTGGNSAESYVSELRLVHSEICAEIKASVPEFDSASVSSKIEVYLSELDKLLTGISTFGECPSGVHCRIMGMGELMCAPIVEAVLLAKKQSVLLLDSRKATRKKVTRTILTAQMLLLITVTVQPAWHRFSFSRALYVHG